MFNIQELQNFLINSIKPYSSILFLNNTLVGFILLLVTFINPSVGISGVVALISTLLFAHFLNIREAYLSQGFYIYNSLLVGMGIGYLFMPSFISVVLIAISSSFTFLFSFMLNRLFSTYKIPILSLPFSIVTIFIYLASLKYSALLSTLVNNAIIYDISLPLIIGGFFKSLGTILFLPNHIAGIVMTLIILYFSRISFIMAIVGYYFGVWFHSFLIGSFTQALHDPYAFNYILVAIALGGIFLLPTIRNFFIALIGVAISVVLTDAIVIFFNYYSLPVFTIPFNITVILFIFVLSMTYYKEFNYNIKSSPEKSLSSYLSSIFRFGTLTRKISLPFIGEWSVYQAFDGAWTHKGEYRYAYDFVIKVDKKSFQNEGLYAQDYYAFGQSIVSPVSGYIVLSRHDLVDNTIGTVDNINNWGNYIIIKSDLGFFVEISHIMQFSITANIGDYIQVGEIIAKCGNSGYSPEPHIHIQVQEIGVLGGFTREFCFKEYYLGEELLFNATPNQDEVVGAIVVNRSISSRLIFILEDVLAYDVFERGEYVESVEFRVDMNSLGAFYFVDDRNNKLYFYADEREFYFYNYVGKESHLQRLFTIMPRIPFITAQKIRYKDYLPINLIYNRFDTVIIEFLSSINKNYAKISQEYRYENEMVSSDRGEVVLDSHSKGFKSIAYNNTRLIKKES
ncbi:MAG: urea transporter [Sulfurovum sp.]